MPPIQQQATATPAVPAGTPIHKLAAELLIEIFLLVPNDTHSSRWHQTVPLRLSAVCRSWRGIAIGTPELWLKLSFNNVLRSGSPAKLRSHLAVVGRDLLQRSSPHKISISFHPNLHTTAERRVALALWSEIVQVADRWRKMDLGLEVLPLLQDTPPRILHRLRHLKISSIVGNSRVSHPEIKFFARAPRLNRVELHNLPNAVGVVLPWSQLKTLDILSFQPPTFHYFEILPRCTALVDLFLVVRAWREDDPSVPSETSPINFPALRYLKLELSLDDDNEDGVGVFDAFFLRVHAPKLLSLDLHCGGYDEEQVELAGIGIFLGRSPLVDNITIKQCTTLLRGNCLLEILDLVPSVTELRFIEVSLFNGPI
ncbi:F-box domain-containing protein [Mycena chlorophos]|uniref:F-box domain-containing protein n=1 Tax=Mycena chlorophos TaxID=658473 RepID=A0A8H6SWK2_MYCCL|nr:F-box domain-containing protein [Mycena chlorophos]